MLDVISEQPQKKIPLNKYRLNGETAELHEKKGSVQYEESEIRELFNILQIHVLSFVNISQICVVRKIQGNSPRQVVFPLL